MHTRTFDRPEQQPVSVSFNPDFSGMAVVYFDGKILEIPAIILTVGIADLADQLWALTEQASNLKDRAADFTWLYTAEDWQEHNANLANLGTEKTEAS